MHTATALSADATSRRRSLRRLRPGQRLAARARWCSTTAASCWSSARCSRCCSAALAATRLTLNASFEKMIPRSHPYIQNYLENRSELRGLGNALRIVVENPSGDIYDPKYLDTLQQDPRRAVPDAGRRPRLGEVAVGARRALDRGHRRRLPRRPGDARQLRRLAGRHRAAARQHRARRHRRQPGRQRLQVEHDRRAAARHRPDHRPAHRLPRAVARRSRRSASASKPTASAQCT